MIIDFMKMISNRGSLDNKDKIGLKDVINNKGKLAKIDKNMDKRNHLHKIDKIDSNGNNTKEIRMEILDKKDRKDMKDKIKNNNMILGHIRRKRKIKGF